MPGAGFKPVGESYSQPFDSAFAAYVFFTEDGCNVACGARFQCQEGRRSSVTAMAAATTSRCWTILCVMYLCVYVMSQLTFLTFVL